MRTTGFLESLIHRPVLSYVINLILFLLGLLALAHLPIREYPQISTGVIDIQTNLPGADLRTVENSLTMPIENAISTIDGVDYIQSSSGTQQSTIEVFLKLHADADKVAVDINNHLTAIRGRLPKEAEEPQIKKRDVNTQPVLYLSFSSKTLPAEQVNEMIRRIVLPQLELISGIGEIKIMGERSYAMRLWLDPTKMAAYQITLNDLKTALQENQIVTSTGRIQGSNTEFEVNLRTTLNRSEDFEQLILKNHNGYFVRIKDIGHAELGAINQRFSSFVNSNAAILLAVTGKANANPLDISHHVHHQFNGIQQQLGSEISAALFWDKADEIHAGIHRLMTTIFETIAILAIIMYAFLKNFRATLIPLVTIPLSLISVCWFLYALGYSINLLTLMAFVLAIGLVVDDAIIVVENMSRHAQTHHPIRAAKHSLREISRAVVAMTLTLAAVYAPLGFIEDATGELFREFAFTLASTVMISGIIALTLSPMMCAQSLAAISHASEESTTIHSLQKHYRHWLERLFSLKPKLGLITLFMLLACFWLYNHLPQALCPAEDNNNLVAYIDAPETANLAFTEKYSEKFSKICSKIPEIKTIAVVNGESGINTAFAFIALTPKTQRKRSAQTIADQLNQQLQQLTGVEAYVINPLTLPISKGHLPIQFVLKTIQDESTLRKVTKDFLQQVNALHLLQRVKTNSDRNKANFSLILDSALATSMGVSLNNFTEILSLFNGTRLGKFSMHGLNYDIIAQFYPEFHDSLDKLNLLKVRSRQNAWVPITNLIQISPSTEPRFLHHFQKLRSVTLTANLPSDLPLGNALTQLEHLAKQLPKTFEFDFGGNSRVFKLSHQNLQALFLFSILFIFLVLGALFESWKDPFIIMFSILFAAMGALITLQGMHFTLNIYTKIALLTLIGLIVKHGILMVAFANQLKAKGQTAKNAIINASVIRLKPILMTTATMLLGAFGFILHGNAAVSQAQLGWTILGGLSIGTLLTLFLLPLCYVRIVAPQTGDDHDEAFAASTN